MRGNTIPISARITRIVLVLALAMGVAATANVQDARANHCATNAVGFWQHANYQGWEWCKTGSTFGYEWNTGSTYNDQISSWIADDTIYKVELWQHANCEGTRWSWFGWANPNYVGDSANDQASCVFIVRE